MPRISGQNLEFAGPQSHPHHRVSLQSLLGILTCCTNAQHELQLRRNHFTAPATANYIVGKTFLQFLQSLRESTYLIDRRGN